MLIACAGMLPLQGKDAGHEYIFNRLDTKDGLASTLTYAVWQDKKGFLWIGSENGLQRYDGYHFMSPYNAGPQMLPRKPVHQILEDGKGRVWIRMAYDVYLFDPQTLRATKVPVKLDDVTLYSGGATLVKNTDGGVYLMIHYITWCKYNEKTSALEKDELTNLLPFNCRPSTVLDDVQTGLLWIITLKGLMAYDKAKKQLYTPAYNPIHHPLLSDSNRFHHALQMKIDSQRRYWIYCWETGQEYACYDEKAHRFLKDTAGLAQTGRGKYYEMFGMTELSNRTMVMFGKGCLSMNDTGVFQPFYDDYTTSYSIVFEAIYAVFEDREKIVWLATNNGLYNTMAVNSSSRHMVMAEKMYGGNVMNVFEMPNHDIWMGTWGSGIIKRTPDLWGESSLQLDEMKQADDNYRMVWSFCRQGVSDNVWIGCQHGRLIYYTPQKPVYLFPKAMRHSTIRSIAEDAQGNTWFGTQGGFVYRYVKGSSLTDSASFEKVFSAGSTINRLKLDQQGRIWVCKVGRGITLIDSKTLQPVRTLIRSAAFDLSSNSVKDVLQANDSIFYIATTNLDIFNSQTNHIQHVSQWRDLPLNEVQTLQTDQHGRVWFSTSNGIFQYQPATGNITRFTQWDGLVTFSNSDYITDASCKLHNGELAFAGSHNMVIFNPEKFNATGRPPNVSIASFRLFNQFIPVDSLLSQPYVALSREQNSITIDFTALSFRQLDKLVYYYMLEGADKDWNKTEHRLVANYNLLPPGDYTFLVKAQNASGAFSKEVTKINIHIKPPFWRTAWFYTIFSILVALAGYSLHRFRINKLLQVEKVRTRLARDLHDDMGSTLSTIHILSNMALRKADTDSTTTKEYIGKISTSSSRIMEAMDDIVWSINPLNDSMRKITARMKEFAGNVLESKDIDYSFSIDEPVMELSFNMEWRRELFLLFKEAINNVAKYSQCSKVEITMRIKNRQLALRIEDDGIGFDTKAPVAENRGNGVKNMQKRAESMNGRFTITSCKGAGTCVEVKIPVT